MRVPKKTRFSRPRRSLPPSNSRRWTGKLVDVIVLDPIYRRPALIKALNSASTISNMAADGVRLPQQPCITAGLRVPLVRGSAKDTEFGKVALRLNPATRYLKTGYPDKKELGGICDYRFRYLHNFARGEWKADGRSIDPLLEQTLGICGHPTPAVVAAALGVVALYQESKGRNCKAMAYAWRGDFKALLGSVGSNELIVTTEFEKLCGRLVKRKGVLGAIILVLEQAMEFERTCDYVEAHLKLFRDTCEGQSKAIIFGDVEPILLFAGVFNIPDITVGNPESHARASADFLTPARLARHRSDARERNRYHSIMGFAPVDFLLLYFFSCHRRFGDVFAQQQTCSKSLNSAFFRLALNLLAHLEFREAHAELAARISHAPQSKNLKEWGLDKAAAAADNSAINAPPKTKSERAANAKLDRKMLREAFDLFDPAEGSLLNELLGDDPYWGSAWVNELRKRYGALLSRGLQDEQKNPFARAFPLPEAWSIERSIASLDMWFGALTDEVSRLDPLYSPIVGKTGKPASKMKSRELDVALGLAAAMIEAPNAISLSRSFAVSPKHFALTLAKQNAGQPNSKANKQHKTIWARTQKKPKMRYLGKKI